MLNVQNDINTNENTEKNQCYSGSKMTHCIHAVLYEISSTLISASIYSIPFCHPLPLYISTPDPPIPLLHTTFFSTTPITLLYPSFISPSSSSLFPFPSSTEGAGQIYCLMCGLFISWRKAARRRGGRDGEVMEVVVVVVEARGVTDGREKRANIKGEGKSRRPGATGLSGFLDLPHSDLLTRLKQGQVFFWNYFYFLWFYV